MSNATGASERAPRRKNRKYCGLVAIAAELSGRSPKTVYAVLGGRVVSAPVEEAIARAALQIIERRRAA